MAAKDHQKLDSVVTPHFKKMIKGFPVTYLAEQNTKVLTMSLSDDKYKKINEYESCMAGITINMNETWNQISYAKGHT